MQRSLYFFLTLLPISAAAAPYDGLYRPNVQAAMLWDCHSVGQDGGAVAVMGDQLIGVENRCTLTNPVEVRGMAATLFDAACNGEGESYSERVMLMAQPGGLYVIRDGAVSDWVRCPGN
jgi:hypothetical protein